MNHFFPIFIIMVLAYADMQAFSQSILCLAHRISQKIALR